MAYFTQDFIDFFAELKEHNVREWFNDHKKRYEKSVKDPFKRFVAEMIHRMHELNPDIQIEPKDAIFRIYRDVRFSKDKSPYKTHVSAIIGDGGRKNMKDPGMYIQLNDNESRIYSGVYQPEKEDLEKIRWYIAEHNDEFEEIINAPDFKKEFGAIRGEKNKILPKDLKEPAAKQPYIFNKQFYIFTTLEPSALLRDDLPDVIMKKYAAAIPLGDFLRSAMNQ